MIKAVVFDVGGTLFRSDSVEKDRELIAGEKIDNFFKMNKINFNLTPRQVADHMVAGDKNFKKWSKTQNNIDISPYELLANWAFKDVLKKENDLRLKIIAPQVINLWKMCGTPNIRKGCAKALAELSKQGFKLGIISNTTSHTNVIIRLFKNNIYKYFDEYAILLSTSSQYRKPGTEIFFAVVDSMGFKPEEVAYVGDRISKDIVGSRAAGFGASIRILPESGIEEPEEGQEKNDTPYIIKNLLELPEMIKKINLKLKKK